jgi:uncharacterized cupredoxin-like copper-binding protein
MSTQTPAPPTDPDLATDLDQVPDATLGRRLGDLEQEIRRQGEGIRATSRNFTIFAVFALLISAGTLLAVAAKLDRKAVTTTRTVTAAAATPAKPATAAPAAAPAALPSTVTEKLSEMKITGSAATVAAGRVTFDVRNTGAVAHEFVVLKTPILAGKLKTSSAGRADESGNIGETGDMAPGTTKKLTIKLAAGHYALICNLPGHYPAGMYADLTVK